MPPRATPYRRRAGAPEDSNKQFRRPSLPALYGTPSARRQYTYGAAEEPSPSRPVPRDDIIDISGAVEGALERREQQRLERERRQAGSDIFLEEAQRQDNAGKEARGQAADLLAMPPPSFTPRRDPPSRQVGFASLADQEDDSDSDDARSFGVESDYYGDATIASTPGNAPTTETRQGRSALSHIRTAEQQLPATSEEPSQTPRRLQQSSSAENEQPSSPSTQDTPGLRSSPRRPKQPKLKAAVLDSQQPGEVQSRVQVGTRSSRLSESSQRAPLRQRSGNSDHGKGEVEEDTMARPSLFAQAKGLAAPASPFSTRPYYASDHSEMDDAMQREIRSDEGESMEDDSPRAWTKSTASLPLLHRDVPHVEDSSHADTINWWQLLNPYTYFQALGWVLSAAYSSFAGFVNMLYPQTLMDGLFSSLEMVLYFVAAVIGLITVISVMHAAIFGKIDGDFSMDRLLSVPEIHWPDLAHVADKAHGLVPAFSWPALSWPAWSHSPSLPDLSHLDNDGLARLDEYLKQYQREFERIQSAGRLHDSSLKKLEAVVPKLVHIELKDGKPVVAQEFWHALRDLIHRDGDFLTFEKKGNRYEVASEAHWEAIASRITKDPTFTKKINATVDSMEVRVKEGAAGFWDSWIRNNDAKISEMLGSALDQIQNAGSQRDFDKRLQRIVKEHIDENKKDSSIVSRDEFLRHLKNEFATHRSEVRAELAELQPQLDNLVRQAAELARKETPESMSKDQIASLVHGVVNKAIADMNLEALARGQIYSHWDGILRQQINYFGVGAGAVIDQKHISSTFDPPASSMYVQQKGIRGVQKPIPRAALEPWTDEGDCWCAARSVNHRGNPHGAILAVILGHRIIPHHIVVEHIVAGATMDPSARPKEIEIYAEIDAELRDLARDFSATHYPDIYPLNEEEDAGWNVSPAKLPERFVKIGQFIYDDLQFHDGVQVHRLSDDLLKLGLATDHVIVRAVSNYGAKTHTCFYRVRLYGHRFQEDGISTW
ncbi:hypothetical protein LMH87_009995 [Akanthomyces muscarius]|uniref:SUN domain-containing protein n=1 Tax=Akanthomyces muscarius TaxID=2231603 RepID=A0A9W8QCX7_AKAMU|nr:hypothetical protein LMH87_009995 [Akanthomyces muscarius]KAJ4153511.1 hypothetical protein LMH87_009995 [Akanthomyces muscarius]